MPTKVQRKRRKKRQNHLRKKTNHQTTGAPEDTDIQSGQSEVAMPVSRRRQKNREYYQAYKAKKLAEAAALATSGESLAQSRTRRTSVTKRYTESPEKEKEKEEKKQSADVQKRHSTDVHRRQSADVQKRQSTEVQRRQSADVQRRQSTDTQKRLLTDVQKKQLPDVQKKQLPDVQLTATSLRRGKGVELLMECVEEELSPCQMAAQKKAWEEHNQAKKLIATATQQQAMPPPPLLLPAPAGPIPVVVTSPPDTSSATADVVFLGQSSPLVVSSPVVSKSASTPVMVRPAPPRPFLPQEVILPMSNGQKILFSAAYPRQVDSGIRTQLLQKLKTTRPEVQVAKSPTVVSIQQVVPTGPPIPTMAAAAEMRPQVLSETSRKSDVRPEEACDANSWVSLDEYYYGKVQGDPSYVENKGEYRMKCWCCSKMLYNNVRAMLHLQGHIDSEKQQNLDLSDLTQCRHCYKQFDTPFEMQTHMEKVHTKNTKVLMCRICERDNSSWNALTTHMRVNHNKCEMPYICRLCNFRSSMYSDVVDHFKKRHDSSGYMLCLYCLKVFKMRFGAAGWASTQMYYYHVLKHNTKSHNRKCHYCKLAFINAPELKLHQKKDHLANHHGVIGLEVKASASEEAVVVEEAEAGLEASPSIKSLNAPAVSKVREFSNLLLPPEVHLHNCIECKGSMAAPDHFKKYMECSMCRFATSCSYAYSDHMTEFHFGRAAAVALHIPADRPLPHPLSCGCGFSSSLGNKLANHMVFCSKRTCYRALSSLQPVGKVAGRSEEEHPRHRPGASLLDVLGLVKKRQNPRGMKSSSQSETTPTSKEATAAPVALSEVGDPCTGGRASSAPESSKSPKETANSPDAVGGIVSTQPASAVPDTRLDDNKEPSSISTSDAAANLSGVPQRQDDRREEESTVGSSGDAAKDSASKMDVDDADLADSKTPSSVADDSSRVSAMETDDVGVSPSPGRGGDQVSEEITKDTTEDKVQGTHDVDEVEKNHARGKSEEESSGVVAENSSEVLPGDANIQDSPGPGGDPERIVVNSSSTMSLDRLAVDGGGNENNNACSKEIIPPEEHPPGKDSAENGSPDSSRIVEEVEKDVPSVERHSEEECGLDAVETAEAEADKMDEDGKSESNADVEREDLKGGDDAVGVGESETAGEDSAVAGCSSDATPLVSSASAADTTPENPKDNARIEDNECSWADGEGGRQEEDMLVEDVEAPKTDISIPSSDFKDVHLVGDIGALSSLEDEEHKGRDKADVEEDVSSAEKDLPVEDVPSAEKDHLKEDISSAEKDQLKEDISSAEKDQLKENISSAEKDHLMEDVSSVEKDHLKDDVSSAETDQLKEDMILEDAPTDAQMEGDDEDVEDVDEEALLSEEVPLASKDNRDKDTDVDKEAGTEERSSETLEKEELKPETGKTVAKTTAADKTDSSVDLTEKYRDFSGTVSTSDCKNTRDNAIDATSSREKENTGETCSSGNASNVGSSTHPDPGDPGKCGKQESMETLKRSEEKLQERLADKSRGDSGDPSTSLGKLPARQMTSGSHQNRTPEGAHRGNREPERRHSESPASGRPPSGSEQPHPQAERDRQQRPQGFHSNQHGDRHREGYRDRSYNRDNDGGRHNYRDRYPGRDDFRHQGYDRSPHYGHGGGRYEDRGFHGYQGNRGDHYSRGSRHGSQDYYGNQRGFRGGPPGSRGRGGYGGGYRGSYY